MAQNYKLNSHATNNKATVAPIIHFQLITLSVKQCRDFIKKEVQNPSITKLGTITGNPLLEDDDFVHKQGSNVLVP